MQKRPKNILRAEMARYRVTQRELAHMLQVTEESIRNWLRGNYAPNIEEAIKIWQYLKARGLEMSLHDLFS